MVFIALDVAGDPAHGPGSDRASKSTRSSLLPYRHHRLPDALGYPYPATSESRLPESEEANRPPHRDVTTAIARRIGAGDPGSTPEA